MTTNAMNCELFTDQLMAYLERDTDDATRDAMERHAVTCAECGALLADLRKLRIDAANLPEMQPSRDLWSGIAARIEAPVVPIGAHLANDVAVNVTRAKRSWRWLRGASIAAGLVLAAGVGYFARGGTAPVAPTTPEVVDLQNDSTLQVAVTPETILVPVAPPAPERGATTESAMSAALTQVARPVELQNAARVVATLAADYDREILRLQRLIDERRNQLDPVTVAIIEKNLKVIDTAITECKKAIASDPASGFLIESLNQSLRSKVELMRTAALLPSRT